MPVEREQRVYETLEKLGIAYIRHTHPAVFTVKQAIEHWKDIKGGHCKNLFVRNKKGNRHYLIIAEHLKKIDLHHLAKSLGDDRLSFASDERLMRYLGLQAGEVSPFGLVHDSQKEVIVVIDADLKKETFVNFHPNVNTATLTIALGDLEKFLAWRGNDVRFVVIS